MTGPGLDTEPALSPDGKNIAFTAGSQHMRGWLLSFDASLGRIVGAGQVVTSPAIEAWMVNLSRDGTKLAFVSKRAGIAQTEEKSLQNDREAPLVADADAYLRDFPQWSPEGGRLVYVRGRYSTGQSQLMVWFRDSRDEQPLTSPGHALVRVCDWSADGK